MPRKQHIITDEERAKRIRETAREFGTSNSPKDFDRAFEKVVTPSAPRSRPSGKPIAT